jgi:hypothetical protein
MGTKQNEESEIIKDFIAAIEKNPVDALSQIQIDAVRKQLPQPRWGVISIYNAIGSVYKNLSREHKDLALGSVLDCLSKERYDIAQGDFASVIDDALLLADIDIASNHLYWPGLFDGRERILINKIKDFDVIKEKVLTSQGYIKDDGVHSEFILTYGLLRSDYWSHNEDFAKALNPKVLDYTVRGIVWMRFGRADTEGKIERGTKRLEELLPECVYSKIEPMRKQGGWVTNPDIIRG